MCLQVCSTNHSIGAYPYMPSRVTPNDMSHIGSAAALLTDVAAGAAVATATADAFANNALYKSFVLPGVDFSKLFKASLSLTSFVNSCVLPSPVSVHLCTLLASSNCCAITCRNSRLFSPSCLYTGSSCVYNLSLAVLLYCCLRLWTDQKGQVTRRDDTVIDDVCSALYADVYTAVIIIMITNAVVVVAANSICRVLPIVISITLLPIIAVAALSLLLSAVPLQSFCFVHVYIVYDHTQLQVKHVSALA
jgi:hypothetical protein